jgi:hypothetical protein
MRLPDAMIMTGEATTSSAKPYWRLATACRVMMYTVAVSPLLLILVLAGVYPDFDRTEIPDWRPLISVGDEAMNSGDRYEARRLYLQADRVAYWRKDWEGLIAAACRINRIDGASRPSSKAISLLFRASTTAEVVQSYRGLATVALSFSMLGSHAAASAVLDRIQAHWPTEPVRSEDLALLAGCSRSQHFNSGSNGSD